jgi:hypothetical protein
MGNQWGFGFPIIDDRIDDDTVLFFVEIGDEEKFDAIWGKFMESPLIKELREHAGGLGVEKYAGYEIQRSGDPESTRGVCMARVDGTLIFSGDVRSIRAAIDAKTKGQSMLARSGSFLSGLPGSASKFAALDFERMLYMENDFVPLLEHVKEGATIAATIDMSPGRIDAVANHSLPEFIGVLVAAELLNVKYQEERAQCLANLRAIGDAIKKYTEATGQKPTTLAQLVPEYLPKERLVCPFDRGKEDVTISYESALDKGNENQWNIEAWCTHLGHRRLVLRKNGQAWSASEESFLRSLRSMGLR